MADTRSSLPKEASASQLSGAKNSTSFHEQPASHKKKLLRNEQRDSLQDCNYLDTESNIQNQSLYENASQSQVNNTQDSAGVGL